MSKCFAEMAFIGSYLFVILSFIIGITYSVSYGRPKTIMIEFLIAWALDQAKSFPIQTIIYWVVIRRLGSYKNVNFTTWDDKAIA
jgi:hypothetical protein